MACGDSGPPAIPQLEKLDDPMLVLEVDVVHHRGEEPVALPRTIRIPLDSASSRAPLERSVEAVLRALLEGPTEEETASGVSSFFSSATRDLLSSIEVEEGLLIVDFHDFRSLMPNAGSSAGSSAFLSQLNGTLFGISGVRGIEYRIEGSCEQFWNFLQRECTVQARPPT